MNDFEKKVAHEYNSRFMKFGAQPKSSLWFSEERQILRFDLIINFIKKNPSPNFFSVNDIGCGYGGFLKRLQANFDDNQFSYDGYDLAKRPIEYCERYFSKKRVRFACGGIPIKKADFSVMSGTFNFAPDLTVKEWEDYLFKSLNSIWNFTQSGMIFNLMISDEAKITSQFISYIERETVIKFCQKNFGVTQCYFSTRLPKELTFYVRRK